MNLVPSICFFFQIMLCEDDSNILKRCCVALTRYAITLLEYLLSDYQQITFQISSTSGFLSCFPSTVGVATFILENENHSTADARPLPHTTYDSTIK